MINLAKVEVADTLIRKDIFAKVLLFSAEDGITGKSAIFSLFFPKKYPLTLQTIGNS